MAVRIGCNDSHRAAETDICGPVMKFVSLGVTTKIVVVVQNQDALRLAGRGLIKLIFARNSQRSKGTRHS